MNSRPKAKRFTKEKCRLMEKKLHEDFLELCKKRTSAKRWWFTLHGRQILNDPYPELKFSDYSFGRFSKREVIIVKGEIEAVTGGVL